MAGGEEVFYGVAHEDDDGEDAEDRAERDEETFERGDNEAEGVVFAAGEASASGEDEDGGDHAEDDEGAGDDDEEPADSARWRLVGLIQVLRREEDGEAEDDLKDGHERE